MKPIRKLAFVVNDEKAGAVEHARTLMAVAKQSGVKLKQTTRSTLDRGFLRGVDACCVIGGDGTLLGVAHEAVREQVPIIGVNRGSLGFLTTFSADEARAQFGELLGGAFCVDHRSMLDCSTGPGLTVSAGSPAEDPLVSVSDRDVESCFFSQLASGMRITASAMAAGFRNVVTFFIRRQADGTPDTRRMKSVIPSQRFAN